MPQVIFNSEWMLAPALSALTGLTDRQMKELRSVAWVEGVHFKRVPLTVINRPKNTE
ncbi:TPA: excisionase family protein [Kluyvera cryocrescens]